MIQDDGLGDWRIQAVARPAKDVPAAFPGAPSHKAGTPGYLTTLATNAAGISVSFYTPSPVAMALDIANVAAARAIALRSTIAMGDVLTPSGPGKQVAPENLMHLYDYFQLCMVTVTFSFQAVEVFCNQTIATKLKGTYSLKRKKKVLANREELQRMASTEEKICDILPKLLGKPSPKGTVVWEKFEKIRVARNTTIHLKARDANPIRGQGQSLFFVFYEGNVKQYIEYALEVISHFVDQNSKPRWLSLAESLIGPERPS